MEKRGLSMIVTSLIIILLVIVAIGILYVAYINFVRTGTEGISFVKFTINLEIENAYIDGGAVKVGVKRNAGKGDLIAINFVIEDEDNSEILREETTLQELGKETFLLTLSELQIDDVETVSIAPIYKSDSGEEVLGDIMDTRKISRESVGEYCGDGTCNGGETCSTCEIDCGVCSGGYCGDGTCNGGETCSTCELDCGDCSGEYCGDGICNGDETCSTCELDCGDCSTPESCNGTWVPPEDDGVECDGGANCDPDCTCPTGFTADGSGGCSLNPPISTGIIFSVWPEDGNANRFQSENLPKSQEALIGYTTYSVNFTGSFETRCFGISSAWYYEDINKSEISLNIPVGVELANIRPSEAYSIWEAVNCGQYF